MVGAELFLRSQQTRLTPRVLTYTGIISSRDRETETTVSKQASMEYASKLASAFIITKKLL